MVGHACLGEKHDDIISNQRTAITQLREKVAELELAKPPSKNLTNAVPIVLMMPVLLVGSHQATLKELSRVRHELLKMKSSAPKPTGGAPREAETVRPQVAIPEEQRSHTRACGAHALPTCLGALPTRTQFLLGLQRQQGFPCNSPCSCTTCGTLCPRAPHLLVNPGYELVTQERSKPQTTC